MNPLFGNGGYGGMPQNNPFGAFGGMMNFMNQLNQFASTVQGNPQQMVEQLRQSGKMSDQQYQFINGWANMIMSSMRR